MVVYPVSSQDEVDGILEKYPWSRIQIQKVRFQGIDYFRVTSSDLNLMKEIADTFDINKDENIRSM